MDAMDILGDLLGQKASKPGRGGSVLKDIFRRGSRQPGGSSQNVPDDIQQEAGKLEELLNVANDRSSRRRQLEPRSPAQDTPRHQRPSSPQSSASSGYRQGDSSQSTNTHPENDHARVLVQAMLNAAKADGKMDRQEQQNILARMENRTPAVTEYLRQEMAQPLDLESFVRTVPLGMEQQVYAMSLIAIDLDTRGEANYLLDLAQGLRLDPDVCEKIHQQLGAASIR